MVSSTQQSAHCVIPEQTPAAFRRTPKGRRQAESRHSCMAFHLNSLINIPKQIVQSRNATALQTRKPANLKTLFSVLGGRGKKERKKNKSRSSRSKGCGDCGKPKNSAKTRSGRAFRRFWGQPGSENQSRNRLKSRENLWDFSRRPRSCDTDCHTWHEFPSAVLHIGKLFPPNLWKTRFLKALRKVFHVFHGVFHNPVSFAFPLVSAVLFEHFARSQHLFRKFPVRSPHLFHTLWKACGKPTESVGKPLQVAGNFPQTAFLPPIDRDSRTLQGIIPPKYSKTSLHGNRRPKTQKNFSHQSGGFHAGKFGEMREVWRGKKSPFKGVLPPPRSSPAPPRSFP